MTQLTIPILFGSVRHDRAGLCACRWLLHALEARGHQSVLIDAAEINLPLLDRMYKEFAPVPRPHASTSLPTSTVVPTAS